MTEQWSRNPWRRTRMGAVKFDRPAPPIQTMTYPFPLHRGAKTVWARVELPVDLTSDEAARLKQHLLSLAVPEDWS